MYAFIPGLKDRGDSESTRITLTDSDDDDFTSPPKKRARKDTSDKQMDEMMKHVLFIEDSITDMMSLQQSAGRIPLGLLKMTRDTFTCSICHIVPMSPPVIAARCCSSIIGCASCVDSWYSGPEALTKDCPKCRSERGYKDTVLLHSLDDFLTQIKQVIKEDDDD